jgi:hypothetical protein
MFKHTIIRKHLLEDKICFAAKLWHNKPQYTVTKNNNNKINNKKYSIGLHVARPAAGFARKPLHVCGTIFIIYDSQK